MELCSQALYRPHCIEESYVLSFVGKTPRLIFVGKSMRITRIFLCTTFAESKYFFEPRHRGMCFNIALKNIEFGSGHCPPESKYFCEPRHRGMCFNIALKNIELGSGNLPPESKMGLYRPFCRDRRPRRSEKVAFCNALSLSQLR